MRGGFSAAYLAAIVLAGDLARGQDATLRDGKSGAESCQISGQTRIRRETKLFEAPRGESALARFMGHELGVKVRVPGEQRLWIETGDGREGVRVRGYVEESAVTLVTTRTLEVVPAQLWLEPGQRVHVTSSGSPGLKVEAVFDAPFAARFTAWAPCDGVKPGVVRATPPKPLDGTAHVARVGSLALYGAPSAAAGPIATVTTSPSFVLWSKQRSRDFLRVRYQGTVGIDAWARADDLLPVPLAEYPEEQRPPLPPEATGAAPPVGARTVVTRRSVAFRVERDGDVVGRFEPWTRLSVQRASDSWISVLPIPLELAPLPGREFWVEARALEP